MSLITLLKRLPAAADVATGSPDGTKFLRDDMSWENVPVDGVLAVVAGTDVTVDSTDPANPVVAARGRSLVSPVGIVTSGALSTTSPVSGTAQQVSTTRDVELHVPVTFNATGSAAATCKVELSPDNTTFSTLCIWTEPINALAGIIHDVVVRVPAAWRVKLTAVNAVLGTGTYY